MKGFQFDKTLSANFSSEQLTEINSLVSLSLFFPRFFRASSTIPIFLPPALLSLWNRNSPRPPTVGGSSIPFDFLRRIHAASRSVSVVPTPSGTILLGCKAGRCKFAEFPGISSRLNAFNGELSRPGTRVINNLRGTDPLWNCLLLSLVKNGQL